MPDSNDSPLLKEAFALIDSVKGKPQSIEEREKLAVNLASLILREAQNQATPFEKKLYASLHKILNDHKGKAFILSMLDQGFRSSSVKRNADQLIYLLYQFGIPASFSFFQRFLLTLFKIFGLHFPSFFVPLMIKALRKSTSHMILSAEKEVLDKHLQEKRAENAEPIVSRTTEFVLHKEEGKKSLHQLIEDLENPKITSISFKLTAVLDNVNSLASEDSVKRFTEILQEIYRAANLHQQVLIDGTKKAKFVMLEAETYSSFHIAVDAFQKVLEETEFQNFSSGITLQAYLPDAFQAQKRLTEWAQTRVKNGGAPIKISIVKGAYLGLEQIKASLKGWPQPPFTSKVETDANFKRMLSFGLIPENARAVRIGVASHNIFDLAFALLLRAENKVEPYVEFEMIYGRTSPIRKVIQKLSSSPIVLYCSITPKHDFLKSISFIARRFDENAGSENFLSTAYILKTGTREWEDLESTFEESCKQMDKIDTKPRNPQNRNLPPPPPSFFAPFENEPDTDFSLKENRSWAEEIIKKWSCKKMDPIPLLIGGNEVVAREVETGFDPNHPDKPLYTFALASEEDIEKVIKTAKDHEFAWKNTTFEERSNIMAKIAQNYRESRADFLGAMLVDGGKTILESDAEVSDSIDIIEYYRHRIKRLQEMKDLEYVPKGTILVISSRGYPLSIPTSGIISALILGNSVLFRPPHDSVLTSWLLVNALWKAGIPKENLQFLNCSDSLVEKTLLQSPEISSVILTGKASTAKKFLQTNPSLDLAASLDGKNGMIITALADRDLAITDLLESAFGYSGQKNSSASLAILEAEVYDDLEFRKKLKETAESLSIGLASDLTTKIGPLLKKPDEALEKTLTSLENGETWLLEPRQDPNHQNLWSPGIKLDVTLDSFTHKNVTPGPLLSLMRAENFQHALELANKTPYGLTAGLHSLDPREQEIWKEKIKAGSCYINMSMTNAKMRRQPFGGCKKSSFGSGFKIGGPNTLYNCTFCYQIDLPKQKHPVNVSVNNLTSFIEKVELSAEQLGIWYGSIANYAYWWKKMKPQRDPSKIIGQDNFFIYLPHPKVTVRIYKQSHPLDVLRVCAAALTCDCNLQVSWDSSSISKLNWSELQPLLLVIDETEDLFLERIKKGEISRIRSVIKAPQSLKNTASLEGRYVADDPVLANGRRELLHYLREVVQSCNYHRYGNLGIREGELRKPIL